MVLSTRSCLLADHARRAKDYTSVFDRRRAMNSSEKGRSLWTGPREDHRRYRVDLTAGVLETVGDGGEGLVYRAVREGDGLPVALKMLTALTLDDYPRV